MSSILDRSPSCGHGAVSSPSSPARSSCNRALCSLPVCPLTIGAGPSRHWRSGRPRLRNRRSATGRARRQEARSGHRGAPPRRPRSPARRMASRETAQANRAGNSDVRRCVKRRGAPATSDGPATVHVRDRAGRPKPTGQRYRPVGAAFKSPVHPAGGRGRNRTTIVGHS